MWSNTVELKMCCGVCKTTVTTRVVTLTERAVLLKDFNEAHKTCRIARAATEAA